MATNLQKAELTFHTDISMRRRYFTRESMAHPAKLHLGLLRWVVGRFTLPGEVLADPMAGSGSLLLASAQQRNVILREVEPKWVEICKRNAERVRGSSMFAGTVDIAEGDALGPWNFTADHIIFSPPYGCRIAPKKNLRVGILEHRLRKIGPEKRDGWLRVLNEDSGAHGALLFHYGEHPGQIGHLRGEKYWTAMERVYTHAHAALRGGYMVLIVKDHIRAGQRVRVVEQTSELCVRLGFDLVEKHERKVYPLSLWQRRRKERGEPVVEDESVLCFKKRLRA
jgi:predicted RNA methylase